MEKLYLWCTSLADKVENGEYVEYFKDYFVESPVCTKVFIAGLVSALIIASIYYFVICNKSFALAKRFVWLITVFLTFAASSAISYSIIIGADNPDPEECRGIYYSSYKTQDRLIEVAGGNDVVLIEINNDAENYREYIRIGDESLPIEIAIVNAFYSILFYFVLSLLFKKHTIHGKAIPL